MSFGYWDPGFLLGQSGLATYVTPWVRTRNFHRVSFTIEWTGVAATAGTLSLEGTDVPADDPAAPPAATSIVPLTITTFHGTWPAVAAVAANALVVVANPPGWVRGRYTRSAGGGAGQFNWRMTANSS